MRMRRARIKYLWRTQFLNPSHCWDNSLIKCLQRTSSQLHFKQKTTFETLWIDSWLDPVWVKKQFSPMACDLIQSSGVHSCRSWTSRAPASFGDYDKIQKLSFEGRLKEAIHLLEIMAQKTSEAPQGAFVCLLRGCTRSKSLAEGKHMHALIIKTKCDKNLFLSNLLMDMYSACGCVTEVSKIFTAMPRHNVFSWTAMISAYAKSRQYKEALTLFEKMHQTGIEPDEVACIIALKACTNIFALEEGQHLHSLILRKGFSSSVNVQNTLVNMYSKCGCLKDARTLFDNMTTRNVDSWNAMITGYAQEGLGKEALDLYEQMKGEGVEVDYITVLLLLKACASISALQQGKQLHSLILQKGFELELILQTTLVDMYSKCGCLKDARALFDNMTKQDVVAWTAMIAGYAQGGLGKEALDLYEQMKHEGMEPDNMTLVLLLKACAGISMLHQGKQLHFLILKKGLDSDLIVQTTLVDMYSKCGSLKDARELFGNMTQRNIVSWTAMIAGYVQRGLGNEALDLYEHMKCEHMKPNNITLVLLLKACGSISALQQGKHLHSVILQKGWESELIVQNALIDMYSKCGSLMDARVLFDNMDERDVISWTSMIAGYSQEGLGKEALDLFQQMKDEGLQANDVTCTCVLSACSHSGLVDEGHHIFENMSKYYGVTPTLEHYACMVDLLGRAGFLSDAYDIISKMQIPPDEIVWLTLLGAARKFTNVEIGRHAFERCMELRPEHAAAYLLLIDIYSAAGRIDEMAQLRKEMNDKGLGAVFGCSRIEVNNQVYHFDVGDSSHLHIKQIYAELKSVVYLMKNARYWPDMTSM